MIKVNELRHGNLVYEVYDQKKTVEEYDFTLHSFHDINLKTSYNADLKLDIFDELEPIPLTEEWLVRFGLKLKPNHTAFHIKGMQFEIPSMIGGYYDNEYGLDKETVIELKHVHQLQNLYFALTGEELKLNDK